MPGTTKEATNSSDFPLVSGSDAFQAAFGIAGASQAAGTPALIPIYPLGRVPRYNLPAGNTDLTAALCRAGILTSVNAGSTTILVRTMAAMSITRNGSAPLELSFLYQRNGVGALFINADVGVTINYNNLEPGVNLPQYHPFGMAIMVADDVWCLS